MGSEALGLPTSLCPSFFLFEDDYFEPHLDRARNSHFIPCNYDAHLTLPTSDLLREGSLGKDRDLGIWETDGG